MQYCILVLSRRLTPTINLTFPIPCVPFPVIVADFNDDQRMLGICSVGLSDSLQIRSVSGKICKESLRAWQLERRSAGATVPDDCSTSLLNSAHLLRSEGLTALYHYQFTEIVAYDIINSYSKYPKNFPQIPTYRPFEYFCQFADTLHFHD